MGERPIIMSGESVRAILDGRKTQTRRVVSDATSQGNYRASQMDLSRAWVDKGPSPAGNPGPYLKAPVPSTDEPGMVDRLYPRWFPGDRLWVRETHALCPKFPATANRTKWGHDPENARVIYQADPHPKRFSGPHGFWEIKWRPSIHMPRWASRLTLEITEVRVQRVQEVTAADAEAEGAPPEVDPFWGLWFASEWDHLNLKRGYGWDSNPWVWALTFTVVPAPGAEKGVG